MRRFLRRCGALCTGAGRAILDPELRGAITFVVGLSVIVFQGIILPAAGAPTAPGELYYAMAGLVLGERAVTAIALAVARGRADSDDRDRRDSPRD